MFRMDNLCFKKGKKPSKRVGRGLGSGLGTTCGRGMKGAGSRSGSKTRLGYEGGNVPFFRRFPKKGFTRTKLLKRLDVINLDRIDQLYSDGEEVSLDTLFDKGFLSGTSFGLKILGRGVLTKKVKIVASEFSASAVDKLTQAGIEFETC